MMWRGKAGEGRLCGEIPGVMFIPGLTFIVQLPSLHLQGCPERGDQPVLSACHPGTVSGIRLVGNLAGVLWLV